jgi:hypothetical protein
MSVKEIERDSVEWLEQNMGSSEHKNEISVFTKYMDLLG